VARLVQSCVRPGGDQPGLVETAAETPGQHPHSGSQWPASPAPGQPHAANACLARQIDDGGGHPWPQMRVLVGVEMRDRNADALDPFQLGAEFAGDVVPVDAPGGSTGDDGSIGERKTPLPVHQSGHFACREEWAVLAHDREMGTEGQAVGRPHGRGGLFEGCTDGQHRRRGHDACGVRASDGAADPRGEAHVVGVDHQQAGHPATGARWASSARSSRISFSIRRMTAGEDSVDTPRVRGK